MKTLLGDLNAAVERGDIFNPTTGNENLHEIFNNKMVSIINSDTSKHLIVKSTMLPHRNIGKYTRNSPDGKEHSQIDHILIDKRRNPYEFDVRSFRGTDCDTEHYLVLEKIR
jgi:hypothetical protein